jgi:hypothetical protein
MRSYRLEETRLRLFYLVAVVTGAFGVVLGALFFWLVSQLGLDVIGLAIAVLPVVLLGGLALAIVYYARSIRLELTDQGVAMRLPGAAVEADWADVERIGPAAWGPLTGDALILRRPARTRWAWWLALLGGPFDESAIPIGPFALPLRGSRLEADLRGRMPALFES